MSMYLVKLEDNYLYPYSAHLAARVNEFRVATDAEVEAWMAKVKNIDTRHWSDRAVEQAPAPGPSPEDSKFGEPEPIETVEFEEPEPVVIEDDLEDLPWQTLRKMMIDRGFTWTGKADAIIVLRSLE